MPFTEWNSATFRRFGRSIHSSTTVAEVVLEIAGENFVAYLKPLGNPAGPHALACELVGSILSRWFGLSTFDFGVMQIEESDEIPLGAGDFAKPGPAFVSRSEPGEPWSGSERGLASLINPEDITRLVVFDTWTLNADRFPPQGMKRNPRYDNVFLSDKDGQAGKKRLMAMDHTHCFTNGNEINSGIGTIDRVKDVRVYGLFEQFKPFLSASRVAQSVEKIGTVSSTLVEQALASVPREWEVNQSGRKALKVLLLERASFLADEVYDMVLPYCSMHDGELSLDGGENNGGK